MMPILAAQLLLPLLMLGLLAFDRGGRGWRLAILLVLVGYLAAIARVGLWTSLPAWTPLALAVAAIAVAPARRADAPTPRRGRRGRVAWVVRGTLLFAGASIAGWAGYEALATRRPPPGEPVPLAFPLEAGRYLVVNGGSRASTNSHLLTLDPRVPRYRAWRGQSYGVDIVAVDRLGRRARGWLPSDPARYAIWNRRVLAPCDGTVLATRGDAPDMPPPEPDRSRMTGNHVLLRCGDAHVLLAHLRRGGVDVAAGQHVRRGQPLGRVGNSGNSDEPHLHVHAQWPGSAQAPFAASPRPLLIDGRYRVRNDVVDTTR